MPAKVAAVRKTQDIELKQVMVEDIDSDAETEWTHHILLVDLGGGSWITADPDHDIESVDLRKSTVVALKRASPFPDSAKDSVTVFDDLAPGQLDQLIAGAYDLAAVLGHAGGPKPTTTTGDWRVADPAFASFDTVVPLTDVLSTERSVVKGSSALVQGADAENPKEWVLVQLVKGTEYTAWLDLKRNGPGKDIRIATNEKTRGGRPCVTLSRSIEVWKKGPSGQCLSFYRPVCHG